ncbi:MAG: ATP-binding protein [Oscillospiraceae bacterium]|nr:ATP-binding protein [Oscillospiraceae bacterium]
MIEYILLRVQWERPGAEAVPLFWAYFMVCFVQCGIVQFFARQLFHRRVKIYKFFLTHIAAAAGAAGIAFAYCAADFSALTYAAVNVGAALFYVLSLHILYSDELNRKIAYVMLSQFVFTTSDLLVWNAAVSVNYRVYDMSRGYFYDSGGLFRVVFCTLVQITALIVMIYVCSALTRLLVTGTAREWYTLNYAAVLLFTASQLISLPFFDVVGIYRTFGNATFLFFAAAFALALVTVIVLLRLMPKFYRRTAARGGLFPSAEPPESAPAPSPRELQKLRHDVKNNIVTITALIDSGNSAEAKRLLNELGDRLTSGLGSEKATGVASIDTTLAAKKKLCEERGVALEMRVEPLPETKIPPLDLSSVLSNILDNALEAAADCPEPVITLRVFKYKMYLAIVCENPVSGKLRIVGNRLITTKENIGQHGYGTEIITEICGRNNGSFRYEHTEKTFKASAFLEI